jgi:hypothetical protein
VACGNKKHQSCAARHQIWLLIAPLELNFEPPLTPMLPISRTESEIHIRSRTLSEGDHGTRTPQMLPERNVHPSTTLPPGVIERMFAGAGKESPGRRR